MSLFNSDGPWTAGGERREETASAGEAGRFNRTSPTRIAGRSSGRSTRPKSKDKQYLAEAEEIPEASGWDVSTELLYGDPVNKLLEFGGSSDVDTIVVGHQGQTARPGGSIGSVAKTLIERASVPVTVAR